MMAFGSKLGVCGAMEAQPNVDPPISDHCSQAQGARAAAQVQDGALGPGAHNYNQQKHAVFGGETACGRAESQLDGAAAEKYQLEGVAANLACAIYKIVWCPPCVQLKELKQELGALRVAKVTGGAPNKLSKM